MAISGNFGAGEDGTLLYPDGSKVAPHPGRGIRAMIMAYNWTMPGWVDGLFG